MEKKGPTLASLVIPYRSPALTEKCLSLVASRKLSMAYDVTPAHFCTSNCYAPRLQDLAWTLRPILMLNTDDVGTRTIDGSSGLQEHQEKKCSDLARSITVAFMASWVNPAPCQYSTSWPEHHSLRAWLCLMLVARLFLVIADESQP